MAFKMKGSPMARNYGATFNKNVEPEQEAAETAQRKSEDKLGAAAGSAQARKDFETETESTTPSGATTAYKAAYDAMSIKLTGNEQD